MITFSITMWPGWLRSFINIGEKTYWGVNPSELFCFWYSTQSVRNTWTPLLWEQTQDTVIRGQPAETHTHAQECTNWYLHIVTSLSSLLHTFRCTEGVLTHQQSHSVSLPLCTVHAHAHTCCAHSRAHMHTLTLVKERRAGPVRKKPAQGHGALSLVGCLLLSVSLDLHQKKYITVTLTNVFCIPNLNLDSALSSSSEFTAAPAGWAKKKKTHYTSVTADRHVANLWNMEEFQKASFNHRDGRGARHTQVWLWRQRLSVPLFFFHLVLKAI